MKSHTYYKGRIERLKLEIATLEGIDLTKSEVPNKHDYPTSSHLIITMAVIADISIEIKKTALEIISYHKEED